MYADEDKINNTVSYKTENPYMDKTSLDDIRGYFHSTKKHHDDIKSMMLRRKEDELIKNIKHHKEYREQQRELRSINNRIIGDMAIEYTDLKRKAVTKDLQVSLFLFETVIENW